MLDAVEGRRQEWLKIYAENSNEANKQEERKSLKPDFGVFRRNSYVLS